jgi:hypothetical protein
MKRTAKKSTNGKKSPEKKAPSKPKVTGKTATSNGSPKKKTTVPNKKRKRDDSDEGDGGEDGYELIGKIVQAPTSGRGTHACTVCLVSIFIICTVQVATLHRPPSFVSKVFDCNDYSAQATSPKNMKHAA